MSKFESGTYNVKITEIDPEHLCATIIESVRGKNKADVELKYACHPKGITIRTDAQRLQQVLINFMTNACKYTEMGSITLGYELRDNSILFSVSDTGVGINSKDAENIFLRFSMLEKSVTGTGLGLHICKLISNMLGGKVYLDTTYKEGARFIFKIPLTT
ncbi:MAG: sensor histidine kinase [Phocaeicola sp.]